jgi:hypothetical protein
MPTRILQSQGLKAGQVTLLLVELIQGFQVKLRVSGRGQEKPNTLALHGKNTAAYRAQPMLTSGKKTTAISLSLPDRAILINAR